MAMWRARSLFWRQDIATIRRKICEGNGREIQNPLKKDIQTLLKKDNVTVESSMKMNHSTMIYKKPLMGADLFLWSKDHMTIACRNFCGGTNGISTSSLKDTLLKMLPNIKDHLKKRLVKIAMRTEEKLIDYAAHAIWIFLTGSFAYGCHIMGWLAAPRKSSAEENNLFRESVLQVVDEKYPVLKKLQSAHDTDVAKSEVAKDGHNKINEAVMDPKGKVAENGETKGTKAAVRQFIKTVNLKVKSFFCLKGKVAEDGEADSEGTKAA